MNYWLAPNGKAYESSKIGCHYGMALDIIDEKFPDLLDEKLLAKGIKMYKGFDAVDDLETRGYIRYCDWMWNGKWIIRYQHKPTRHQIKKMFELTGFIYTEDKND